MTPFKLPVHCLGSALVDAGNNHLADLAGAKFSTRHAILKAINNVPLHAALAEYYAASEAQDADRLYEARKTIHHLLEQA